MSKFRLASITLVAALGIVTPFIYRHEGEKLAAYKDPVGIWTICQGETENVTPGMRLTKQECDDLTRKRLKQFMAQVSGMIKAHVTPEILAAHTSFAYNIGVGGYSRSQALKKTNAGDLRGGCLAMLNWYTAGGRDCRIKESNCYGLITRRNQEVALCLSGLE